MKHKPDNCPKKPKDLKMFEEVKNRGRIMGYCEYCECQVMYYRVEEERENDK